MNKITFPKIIILLLLMTMSISAGAALAKESVYVFFPSAVSAASMQKQLSEGWPELDIMVFGRFKDFEARVALKKPDAVLTIPPVIEAVEGYHIRLQGIRSGRVRESYVFLSVGKAMDLNRIGEIQIGVFDILGRKGMRAFIEKFFSPPPRLRRVSKIEDLLQMLTFNMVGAILIPESYIHYYRGISKLDFVVTPLPHMKTGILSLGLREGKAGDGLIRILTSSDKRYKELLGVDKWE